MIQKSTIRDVAAKAEVSPATVSRAIHSPHLLKPSTLIKIQNVMRELRYVYNKIAADLTTKKVATIGLIVPTIANSIHAELIHGIQDSCQKEDLSVIIGNTDYRQEPELELLRLFIERRVSGIIQAGIISEAAFDLMTLAREHGIPSVVVWECINRKDISSVGIDNYDASYKMMQSLFQLGHRRIGLIIGPFHCMNRLKLRFDGYRDFLECHKIEYDQELVIEKDHSILAGVQAMQQLAQLKECPSAVFAASDVLAFGALAGAKKSGLRVPEDISIAGFDDIEFVAFSDPPLTTVHVPAWEMGSQSVYVLLDMLDKSETMAVHHCFDTNIVHRASISCSP